jgi:hypothetical protein
LLANFSPDIDVIAYCTLEVKQNAHIELLAFRISCDNLDGNHVSFKYMF